MQSAYFNPEGIKGTPKYLTGRVPSGIPRIWVKLGLNLIRDPGIENGTFTQVRLQPRITILSEFYQLGKKRFGRSSTENKLIISKHVILDSPMHISILVFNWFKYLAAFVSILLKLQLYLCVWRIQTCKDNINKWTESHYKIRKGVNLSFVGFGIFLRLDWTCATLRTFYLHRSLRIIIKKLHIHKKIHIK